MNNTPLLEAKDLSIRFGKTQALDNASFELEKGEVHALMGENGAGKSTLGKCFAGIYKADSGEIFLNGEKIEVDNPRKARDLSISMVMQEFNLYPDLSVAENLFLSNDKYFSNGVIHRKEMNKRANELLNLFDFGKQLSPNDLIRNLSVAKMQIVEILRAVDEDSNIIILDEPTAALASNEVTQLFDIINQLKKNRNMSFIIVSHRIEEIYTIADRVTVLRDGKVVLKGQKLSQIEEDDLVNSMVGRKISDLYGKKENQNFENSPTVLKIENLRGKGGFIDNINFVIRKGEILGLTGLAGAGRTELGKAISGIDKIETGKVFVEGKEITSNLSVKKAIKSGICYVPEDRKSEGLLLDRNISSNINLAKHAIQKSMILNKKEEILNSKKQVKELNIKIATLNEKVSTLSGGNQQKVLLGKWISMNPKVLIIDEPTRGIDISAKSEIYTELKNLAKEGMAILVISSELPEVLGICDRILVMRYGNLVGDIKNTELTEEIINRLATIGAEEDNDKKS